LAKTEAPSAVDEPGSSTRAQVRFGRIDAAPEDVARAIERSRDSILARQHPEGYWSGELEGDSMLEADYIFVHVLLGTGSGR
jgi:squalene-hopene/tetraprenyl-beta-curcumene cyclase